MIEFLSQFFMKTKMFNKLIFQMPRHCAQWPGFQNLNLV